MLSYEIPHCDQQGGSSSSSSKMTMSHGGSSAGRISSPQRRRLYHNSAHRSPTRTNTTTTAAGSSSTTTTPTPISGGAAGRILRRHEALFASSNTDHNNHTSTPPPSPPLGDGRKTAMMPGSVQSSNKKSSLSMSISNNGSSPTRKSMATKSHQLTDLSRIAAQHQPHHHQQPQKAHLCICGMGKHCQSISLAWSVLAEQDVRSRFVELPPAAAKHRIVPSDNFTADQLRAAYLQALCGKGSDGHGAAAVFSRQCIPVVALHHFHPAILVQQGQQGQEHNDDSKGDDNNSNHDDNRDIVTRTMTRRRAALIGYDEKLLDEEYRVVVTVGGGAGAVDCATSSDNDATDPSYFVVPNYPLARAKQDLQHFVTRRKLVQQQQQQQEEEELGVQLLGEVEHERQQAPPSPPLGTPPPRQPQGVEGDEADVETSRERNSQADTEEEDNEDDEEVDEEEEHLHHPIPSPPTLPILADDIELLRPFDSSEEEDDDDEKKHGVDDEEKDNRSHGSDDLLQMLGNYDLPPSPTSRSSSVAAAAADDKEKGNKVIRMTDLEEKKVDDYEHQQCFRDKIDGENSNMADAVAATKADLGDAAKKEAETTTTTTTASSVSSDEAEGGFCHGTTPTGQTEPSLRGCSGSSCTSNSSSVTSNSSFVSGFDSSSSSSSSCSSMDEEEDAITTPTRSSSRAARDGSGSSGYGGISRITMEAFISPLRRRRGGGSGVVDRQTNTTATSTSGPTSTTQTTPTTTTRVNGSLSVSPMETVRRSLSFKTASPETGSRVLPNRGELRPERSARYNMRVAARRSIRSASLSPMRARPANTEANVDLSSANHNDDEIHQPIASSTPSPTKSSWRARLLMRSPRRERPSPVSATGNQPQHQPKCPDQDSTKALLTPKPAVATTTELPLTPPKDAAPPSPHPTDSKRKNKSKNTSLSLSPKSVLDSTRCTSPLAYHNGEALGRLLDAIEAEKDEPTTEDGNKDMDRLSTSQGSTEETEFHSDEILRLSSESGEGVGGHSAFTDQYDEEDSVLFDSSFADSIGDEILGCRSLSFESDDLKTTPGKLSGEVAPGVRAAPDTSRCSPPIPPTTDMPVNETQQQQQRSLERFASEFHDTAYDWLRCRDILDEIVGDITKAEQLVKSTVESIIEKSRDSSSSQPPEDENSGAQYKSPSLTLRFTREKSVQDHLPALQRHGVHILAFNEDILAKVDQLKQSGDRIMQAMHMSAHQEWKNIGNTIGLAGSGDELCDTPCRDRWVHDVAYPGAVQMQLSTWNACCSDIEELLKKMMQWKVSAYSQLSKILSEFSFRRRQMFLCKAGLSELASIKELLTHLEETNERTDIILALMMTRCQQRQTDQDAENKPSSKSPWVLLRNYIFNCDLVREFKVLEFRHARGATSSPWRAALAITTVDNFMHILTTESEASYNLSLPSTESLILALASEFQMMGPDLSLCLRNCSLKKCNNGRQVEIVSEESFGGGLMLKRKFFIRLSTAEEASNWFESQNVSRAEV